MPYGGTIDGRRFVILGGGTAGWMTACLIKHRWPGAVVTVIESPEIGIIGVGEGSTPQMKAFFEELGIAEREWMPRCNATYKVGIRFHGWSDAPGFDQYFHPFATALDDRTLPHFYFNTRARRTGRDVWAHPDRFCLPAELARRRLGPRPEESFPFEVSYGYHFDAVLVGVFLRDHATQKLGVVHLERTIEAVTRDERGAVAALIDAGGEQVSGDFFIDCSGFRGRIVQEALAERFIAFGDNLWNDRAVAMPSANATGSTPCETRATAMAAGWTWHIPLTNRTGNGYVYSSAALDRDAAETELRRHLGMLDAPVEARHLAMKVGRVARSWVGNALAVGLAQGFIEPLEATALHIVHATVGGFIEAYEQGGFTAAGATQFNERIASRYEGIRDYIVAHYRMNRRSDTEYWRANAANDALSEPLKSLMTSWFRGDDLSEEIARQGIARYYAPLSWHCLFGGYGTYPDGSKLSAPEAELPTADMAAIDDFIRRCAMNFPPHDDQLAHNNDE